MENLMTDANINSGAQAAPQDQPQRESALNDNVYLVYVSMHMPRLNFNVRGAAVEVNGVALNHVQTTQPQWKLMPARHKDALNRFNTEKCRICDLYNIPVRTRASGGLQDPTEDVVAQTERFYLKGCYLIPESRLDYFVEEMEGLNSDLREYVRTEMVSDMEQFRASIREQIADDEAYEQCARHIPSGEDLLAKTLIDWTPIPIQFGQNRDAEAANVSELRQLATARADEFVQGVLDSVFSEPRAELIQAIESFEDLIKRDGFITAKSLPPIHRAIEKFRSFQNMGDPEFDQLVHTLEERFTPQRLEQLRTARTSDMDSVRKAANRTGITQALRSVREQAQQDTVEFQQHGRMSRGISFTAPANE